MIFRPSATALAALCFLVFASYAIRAEEPPAWLVEASRIAVPAYDIKNVPAVVLRNEETIVVNSDGTVTRTTRYAIRVLVREGREEAFARVVYQTDSEKVRALDAWLIRRSGQPKTYGKKEVVDLALAENDLYNEARIKVINASEEVDAGDVFGFESVSEERTIFSQFQFQFQDDLPVIQSRFNLTLPSGWRAESVTFNHAKVEPAVNGSSYNWELRSLAPIPHEVESPSRSSLSPRLAVSFFPTSSAVGPVKTFSNWSDVARWMSDIEDPQMTVDDALAVKAKELTANAKTEFEKIQAISRYVQGIQYISIQVGTGKGGGYIPHTATEVFAKSYGDCKDKANLMRAMLSVLKIQSFMVSITADDRTFVRAEWASPHQFNHCIIAIRISDATKSPAVVVHPALGRLLMFDPTDPYTPIGDLPDEQQGSLALIDHKDTAALTEMPVLPAETNRLERTVEISLDPAGDIAGKVSEKSVGQAAAQERARLRGLSTPEYNRLIEGWVARGAAGAKALKITAKDGHSEGNFNLDVEFSANSYAQLMQGRLMVFKPAIIGRLERLRFTEGDRAHPYVIDATTYSESVKIKLPAGFAVDEVPEAAKLETSFGKYSADYVVQGDSLVFTRSLTLNRATIPASNYDTVKKFFGSVHAAEQSPVVLIKK
jgi:hypothetical protein